MIKFDMLYDQAPEYFNFMKDTFSLCKDKTVLELGAFEGRFSNLILQNTPTSLTVVEPNDTNPGYNTELRELVDFHACTLNDYYNHTKKKVDVVIACGLFYHLHSPLHALELILNHSDPDIIIMDSPEINDLLNMSLGATDTPLAFKYRKEEVLQPGGSQPDNGITKPISISVSNPYATIKLLLKEHFGYSEECVFLPTLGFDLPVSKERSLLSIFRKGIWLSD